MTSEYPFRVLDDQRKEMQSKDEDTELTIIQGTSKGDRRVERGHAGRVLIGALSQHHQHKRAEEMETEQSPDLQE